MYGGTDNRGAMPADPVTIDRGETDVQSARLVLVYGGRGVMAQRRGYVLIALAGILGLSILGAPLPAGAAPAKSTIARPTHLRPVQSKADCVAVLSLLAAICDSAVKQGDLQLIWDESDKAVTGYKVFRVDGGGHQLLGTVTKRYFLVKKPSEGYANLCFAVQALAGKQTSADSPRYCYAPGATATTRSFKASFTQTQVAWSASKVDCGSGPFPASAFFQAADKEGAFTAFFPPLRNEPPTSGSIGVLGVYAGAEAALLSLQQHADIFGYKQFCSGNYKGTNPSVQVNALAGMAFDLGELARHKFYSAALTLESVQTLVYTSGKFTLQGGGWCAVHVGAATREWRLSPLGNMTYSKRGLVTLSSHPQPGIDVSPIVSVWASQRYAAAYGFIVAGLLQPGPNPPTSEACLTKYASPSLKVVYF